MARIIATALLALSAQGAFAQSCSEIRFSPGTSSGEVSGEVSSERPACFLFGSGAGQTARLRLSGSENTCFTLPGVVDCRDDFSFRTERRTYQVNVFQLFEAPGTEAYSLRLSID